MKDPLRSDIAIALADQSGDGDPPFPIGTPTPVVMFLSPPMGHASTPALLEALGTMLWRALGGRLEGFSSSFADALAELDLAEEEDEGALSSRKKSKRQSGANAAAWTPSVEDKFEAFFSLLREGIQELWNEESEGDDDLHASRA
jgi:hypothetical protein